MRIALDLMGGDHAPEEIIKGGLAAAKDNPELQLIMVGTEAALAALPPLPDNISTVQCSSVMGMDEAVDNLMRKKDSSIFVATKLVKDKAADAVVSAGSTGAQLAAAVLLLGRCKGIKRPAIASILPCIAGPKVILDMGANPDADAAMLEQFALMGKIYAKCLLDMDNPRIGLLSNGTEECKGNATVIEANSLLRANKSLNFIGNVEGRSIVSGEDFDVLVCDGFSGNIAVKCIEGTAGSIFALLKEALGESLKTKLGALLLKEQIYGLKGRLDYSRYGGAPLLGVKGVSLICHGSSKAEAMRNACHAAEKCCEQGFCELIAAEFALPPTEL